MSKQGGATAIAAERQRQIDQEGYTPEHDAHHPVDDFVSAAVAQLGRMAKEPWPVKFEGLPDGSSKARPSRRDLVKAGALIAAAIDRLAEQDGA